jgi:AcrR family transcriptional regulator
MPEMDRRKPGLRKGRPQKNRPGKQPADRARADKLQAILAAAFDVFIEKGFADTRLDEVAARAGVAKGTIYLYVPSKTALFEELVRSAIRSPIEGIGSQIAALDQPVEDLLRLLFRRVREEVLETRRREIARLVIAEAGRFPEIAELYHREVISRGLALLRGILARARERGEIHSDELVRFPQLVIAPVVVALLWTSLFQGREPLDTQAMLDAHVDLLIRALKGGAR